jgi:hypothetical protein
MMSDILTHTFSSKECSANILFESQHIRVQFTVHNAIPNSDVHYIASAPAVRNNSFSGSGLPYPSEEVAFENTPFKGTISLKGNTGEITLTDLPNSYYVKLGSVLIPPSLRLSYSPHITYIVLCDSIPYRTLTYDYRRSEPGFYNMDLPVRSQERILRDSAYDPTYDVRKSFWALRPPY